MGTHLCDYTICDMSENMVALQMGAHFNDYLIYDMGDNMITPPYYR